MIDFYELQNLTIETVLDVKRFGLKGKISSFLFALKEKWWF